jgi:NAD(P)-dependent dehydrogenase (short-subunit alcohol dehydrogenase family)
MAEQQFGDKVTLVTGAASGIGRACALLFAEQGASVVVSDVAVEGGEETVRLIEEVRGKATFIAADVSNAREVEALVVGTVETYDRLGCAVNNAGIEGVLAPTANYPDEIWTALSHAVYVELVVTYANHLPRSGTKLALVDLGGYHLVDRSRDGES